MELGYLETRVFVVSNSPSEGLIVKVLDGIHACTNMNRDFVFIMDYDTNSLTVLYPREEGDVWHQMIREADVPQTGQ